jgi:hypothetical protein
MDAPKNASDKIQMVIIDDEDTESIHEPLDDKFEGKHGSLN